MTSCAKQVEQMIQGKFATVEFNLNQMVNEMLQDVSLAADDAQTQLKKSVEENLDKFMESLALHMQNIPHQENLHPTQSLPLKSNRFPNVTLDASFRRSPNPYDIQQVYLT